jgi:hypothetical protein
MDRHRPTDVLDKRSKRSLYESCATGITAIVDSAALLDGIDTICVEM